MQKRPNKKAIGLFVVLGFMAFFSIVGVFVVDKIIPDNRGLMVMYFEESVKGLSVGSPVVFEGVELGKVTKIDLLAETGTMDFKIAVYARLPKASEFSNFQSMSFIGRRKVMDELVQKGLRAQLVTQSYLTGQLMIELKMVPDAPAVFKHDDDDKDILEIPTVLSALKELSRGIQDMPIRQMVDKLNNILNSLETGLPVILPQFALLGEKLNAAADRNGPQTTIALDKFNQTLGDVGSAAKALRNFADYIERHPEALLKGKGMR